MLLLQGLKRNRILVIFLLGLSGLAWIGAWHFLESPHDANASPLSLLTPHGDNIRQEIGAAFATWMIQAHGQTVRLEWMDQGGTSEDLRYVQSRFSKTPDGIGLDIFFGGGTPPFRTLAKAGLLQPRVLPESTLARLPGAVGGVKIFDDSAGWYGVALSGFGILFNRPLLKSKHLPEPESWWDLAQPEADQFVACVDPRGSGSAHVIYEIILQKYGWERGWGVLTRMAANSAHFTKGASAVLPLVASGDAAYSLAIDQYAWSLLESLGDDRVGFILPPGETVVTPDPVAILKGAPHRALAEMFLQFLVTPEAQKMLMVKAGMPGGPARLSLNRMSVLPNAYAGLEPEATVVRGNPFADAGKMGWIYSDSLTESRWAFLNDALGLWMVDFHAQAHAAWQSFSREALPAKSDTAARAAWDRKISENKFFRPPVNWSDAQALSKKWKDDAFRNTTLAAWAEELHD